MKRTSVALFTLLASLNACDKKEAAPAASTAASSATAGTSAQTTAAAAPASDAAPAAGSQGGPSQALGHLPSGCDAIARLDVAKILATPAVKSQVVPALEDMKKAPATNESQKNFRSFIADAGIDPLTDIKEFAICAKGVGATPGATPSDDFVFVLGGNFKPGAIVPALGKNGKKDALKLEDLGGTPIAVGADGKMAIGQAADGAVVIGGNKAALESALKASGDATKLGVPTDVAVAFLMPAEAMKKAMSGPGTPFSGQADKAGRALLTVDLAKPSLQVRVAMADDKAATELAGALKMILGQLASQPLPEGDPSAAFLGMLKAAKIEGKGAETVVDVTLPPAQLDDLGKQLAEVIREGGPGSPGKR